MMRFYEDDGWTREILENLVEGEVEYPFPDDQSPYFVLGEGSVIDLDALFELPVEVVRYSEDHSVGLLDREYLERNYL